MVEGCDGLVFVADSHPDREDANQFALENLEENLAINGTKMDEIPLIFQWNKRDLKNAMKVSLMQRQLNPRKLPAIEASASTGEGVWETQQAILRATLQSLRQQFRRPR